MVCVKTHTFNGKCYHVYIRPPVDGLCDREPKELGLYIFQSLRTKEGLITTIHETLHAESQNMPEDCVDRISREIGTFLWRLGYRWKPSRNDRK